MVIKNPFKDSIVGADQGANYVGVVVDVLGANGIGIKADKVQGLRFDLFQPVDDDKKDITEITYSKIEFSSGQGFTKVRMRHER